MKWVAIIAGAIVALILLVGLVGSLLPRGHVARRTATFKAPPEAIWATIADVGASPAWRKDVKSVEVLAPVNGHTTFRETSTNGAVLYEVTETRAPSRLVTRIADENLPYGGTWTYDVEPDGGGTRVTITENGEIKNVWMRALAKVFMDMNAGADAYLRAIGDKHGASAPPGPA